MYRTNNDDKIKENKKIFYENNVEIILEQKKICYQNNFDKLKEKNKIYYENNVDKIKEQKKEKISCDCGSCVNRQHLSRHYKTEKHQDYVSNL